MADTLTRAPPRIEARSWLEPLPPVVRHSLRGGADVLKAVDRALGIRHAPAACRAAISGSHTMLWLGPDEQLLLTEEADAGEISIRLAAALSGTDHSLVDVSHRQIAFALKGPHATWLLAHGCPLDLDLAAFPVGMCTRTVFAKAEILLWRTAVDTFRVEVWRSYADYVLALLNETALELPA